MTDSKTTQIKHVQELTTLINHLKHHSYLFLLSSRLSYISHQSIQQSTFYRVVRFCLLLLSAVRERRSNLQSSLPVEVPNCRFAVLPPRPPPLNRIFFGRNRFSALPTATAVKNFFV